MSGPGRLAAALLGVLAVAGGAVAARGARPPALEAPSWIEVAPGIEFGRVDLGDGPRRGGIAAVRLDPRRCRIEPYHEREFPGEKPATVDGWTRRLGAPVVVNAGLYREDRTHLGTLRRGGNDIGGSRHRTYKGMLVSDAQDPRLPAADVLDLSTAEGERRVPRYANAVQSMMLFDRQGVIRVRRTDRAAPRTVVAADREGRLVVAVTEGPHTLWELAELLRGSSWNLELAMALDGGREANLSVEASAVRYRTHQGDGNRDRDPYLRESVTLPAVIAVWPRTPAP